jgi:membrane-bound metal-dependent hydrolase YbcI (DUF457 family)
MFVGHYAAALAAKGAEPRAPLWTYVIGAQLIDIGWSGLVMAGVERVSFDPKLPGSALVLEHMPWTHSLPAALVWAAGAALLVRWALKLPWGAAIMVGLVVFSHWLADLVVHRPDLELWFGGRKVGLGLWNYPVPEQALEMGLLAIGAAWWGWRRGRENRPVWPALVFVGLLMGLQILAMVLPGGAVGDPVSMGRTALLAYLVTGGLAWLADRGQPRLT